MKRKRIIVSVCAVVALSLVGIGAIMRYNATHHDENECVALGSTEARCNGTVGCGCTGFSPKTNGSEWEKSYCKKCGHHKRNHR